LEYASDEISKKIGEGGEKKRKDYCKQRQSAEEIEEKLGERRRGEMRVVEGIEKKGKHEAEDNAGNFTGTERGEQVAMGISLAAY